MTIDYNKFTYILENSKIQDALELLDLFAEDSILNSFKDTFNNEVTYYPTISEKSLLSYFIDNEKDDLIEKYLDLGFSVNLISKLDGGNILWYIISLSEEDMPSSDKLKYFKYFHEKGLNFNSQINNNDIILKIGFNELFDILFFLVEKNIDNINIEDINRSLKYTIKEKKEDILSKLKRIYEIQKIKINKPIKEKINEPDKIDSIDDKKTENENIDNNVEIEQEIEQEKDSNVKEKVDIIELKLNKRRSETLNKIVDLPEEIEDKFEQDLNVSEQESEKPVDQSRELILKKINDFKLKKPDR